jgi:hypothetical protein
MAEPIGGKEHRWGLSDLLKLGYILHVAASVMGWIIVLGLPFVAAYGVYRWSYLEHQSATLPSGKDLVADGSGLLVPFLKLCLDWVLLTVCMLWASFTCAASAAFLYFMMKSTRSDKVPDSGCAVQAGGQGAVAAPEKSGSAESAPAAPAVGVETPEQTKKKAEAERKKQEQDRRDRVEESRKEFKVRFTAFRNAIPAAYVLSIGGGTLDFSEKFKSTPLKVTMREGSLRSYLAWDREGMVMVLNDAYAFFKDRKVKFVLEVSDPAITADPELRDEIKAETLEVTLQAEFPTVAEKFFEWKSKMPTPVRLENAKQGQEVDYDLKSILSFDAQWLIWKDAKGLGSLEADFETQRIKGLPTVGNDNKIRVIFACRGCESLTHEIDLLLTCNMDAEQLWKQIEEADSDKDAVVSDDEVPSLAKMAEAVRSSSNSYEVAKPDDLFSKPHRVSRRQKSAGFDLAYASIRGRSHVKGGSFREDHADARFFHEGKAVAIIVSDGAGSAPLSRRGSRIVASFGVRSLVKLGEDLLANPECLKGRSQAALDGFAALVQTISAQIEFESECIKERRPDFLAKEMYATFLAALVLPTPEGDVLLTYSAGDGAIGLGLAGGASGLKCVPDHGQSAGQTLFILNKGANDAEKRLVHTKLPENYALLLMSDGVSDPLIPHGEDDKPAIWDLLAEELKPIVEREPFTENDTERVETFKERGGLCAWLDSYQKGHHDDRTIAVLFHKLS